MYINVFDFLLSIQNDIEACDIERLEARDAELKEKLKELTQQMEHRENQEQRQQYRWDLASYLVSHDIWQKIDFFPECHSFETTLVDANAKENRASNCVHCV